MNVLDSDVIHEGVSKNTLPFDWALERACWVYRRNMLDGRGLPEQTLIVSWIHMLAQMGLFRELREISVDFWGHTNGNVCWDMEPEKRLKRGLIRWDGMYSAYTCHIITAHLCSICLMKQSDVRCTTPRTKIKPGRLEIFVPYMSRMSRKLPDLVYLL